MATTASWVSAVSTLEQRVTKPKSTQQTAAFDAPTDSPPSDPDKFSLPLDPTPTEWHTLISEAQVCACVCLSETALVLDVCDPVRDVLWADWHKAASTGQTALVLFVQQTTPVDHHLLIGELSPF